MRKLLGTMAAVQLVLGGLLCAAVARADAGDQVYLSALASQGISVGPGISQHSADTLIGMGHGVCEELGEGKTPVQIADEIASTARLNPADPLGNVANAGFLVAAAVAEYCPQYRALIR